MSSRPTRRDLIINDPQTGHARNIGRGFVTLPAIAGWDPAAYFENLNREPQ